ncbi:hypothetical protein BJY01DRAFT_59563 [Aspergillus pseudoustus]|uniref:UbiA prenyltransferase family-domain-containing protein n=1 Tax=Aspergillus pseudoustus TaxID=1810923 RepID=A0ABR4J8T6_9EURO
MIGLIFATTGHAQVFRDRTADRLMNRKTLPLLLPPRVARYSLAGLILLWTAALVFLWSPPDVVSAVFVMTALCAGGAVSARWDEADQWGYVGYAVWLLLVNVLPGFCHVGVRE